MTVSSDAPERDAPADAEAAPPATGNSWWQFSLRTLLLVTTVIALALAWFINVPERRRLAALELREAGGSVWFEVDDHSPVLGHTQAQDDRLLPREYTDTIRIVNSQRLDWSDKQLARVADLPYVECLIVGGSEISNRGLAHLSGLGRLKSLTISHVQISDDGLAHIGGLPELTGLFLHAGSFTDAGLRHLSRLTKLEHLVVEGENFTDAGLAHLSQLTNLKRLTLRGNFTDAGLAHLARLPQLEVLQLEGPMPTINELAEMQLANSQITGVGFRDFASRQSLVEIYMSRTRFSDEGLTHLGDMSRLEVLDLSDTHVTDAGLAQLSSLPNLRMLDLNGTYVTDAGLEHLAGTGLKNLQTVACHDTDVTAAGADKLSARRRWSSSFGISWGPSGRMPARFLPPGSARIATPNILPPGKYSFECSTQSDRKTSKKFAKTTAIKGMVEVFVQDGETYVRYVDDKSPKRVPSKLIFQDGNIEFRGHFCGEPDLHFVGKVDDDVAAGDVTGKLADETDPLPKEEGWRFHFTNKPPLIIP